MSDQARSNFWPDFEEGATFRCTEILFQWETP